MIQDFYLDMLLLIPAFLGLLRGWRRGFIREVAALLSLVISLFLSYRLQETVYAFLYERFDEKGAFVHALSFILVFVASMIALNALARLLTKLIESAQLGTLNRLAGGLFGCIKWLILTLVLVQVVFLLDQRFDWFDSREILEKYPVLTFFQSSGEWLFKEVDELLPAKEA